MPTEDQNTKAQTQPRWCKATHNIAMEKAVVDAIIEERNRRKRMRRMKKGCKKVLRFFLSTAGLLVLNAVVMVLGAVIFQHLEKENEVAECYNKLSDYEVAEHLTLDKLMRMTERVNDVGELRPEGEAEVVKEFEDTLKSFALSVLDTNYKVTKVCDLMGTENGEMYDWSYMGALVFALTVVTTIGYGSIAPSTMWGRLVVIAYALIGIPIFMLALANIGEILAKLFKITYSTVCCCGCCRKKDQRDVPMSPEEEEYINKTATLWRIDPVTGKPIAPEQSAMEENEEMFDDEEDEDNTNNNLENELTVPLTITVLVYFVFILFGAVTFSALEEEWTFLDSFYYSTITATTIGFGDLVPDMSLDQGRGVFKTIYVILYITFSMAAISMCLQLIADELVAKFRWVGQKLGIRKQATDEEEALPTNTDTNL